MKIRLSTNQEQGLTLVEVFVVIVVIAIFAAMLLPADTGNKARSSRIQCVNNLKQVGLAFRVWEGDHEDKYPMSVSETNGGTMEFATGPNLWRHFQIASNELSTPKVLICPKDKMRTAATNFAFLRNSNISFFVDLEANETDPQLMLAGDSNLTNGTPIRNGILEVSTNQLAGWTGEIHNRVGNVALSDGSIQQLSGTGLRSAIQNSGGFTNHLQMPIPNL